MFVCQMVEFLKTAQKVWFEINERTLNLNFKPTQLIFLQNSVDATQGYCKGTVAAIVTLGLSQPSPITEILT
jgi:hypothetical protein